MISSLQKFNDFKYSYFLTSLKNELSRRQIHYTEKELQGHYGMLIVIQSQNDFCTEYLTRYLQLLRFFVKLLPKSIAI